MAQSHHPCPWIQSVPLRLQHMGQQQTEADSKSARHSCARRATRGSVTAKQTQRSDLFFLLTE